MEKLEKILNEMEGMINKSKIKQFYSLKQKLYDEIYLNEFKDIKLPKMIDVGTDKDPFWFD